MEYIKKIVSWLNKPMPFFETTKQKLIISIIFGFSIIFFLIFFDQHPSKAMIDLAMLKAFGYGFITFLVLFFYSYFLPILFPKFFAIEKWTVWKSLLYGIILIISVGLVNTLFAFKFDNPNQNNELFSFLVAVVYRTFMIGIIPSIIFHFWLERKFYKEFSENAILVDKQIEKSINNWVDQEEVSLEIIQKNKNLVLKNSNIIFIKSEGNYCQIFFKDDTIPQKIMIRKTLKDLEQELSASDSICRCHKSYIVNLDHVAHIKGNARGYYFEVKIFNYEVPVSRELSKKLFEKLQLN